MDTAVQQGGQPSAPAGVRVRSPIVGFGVAVTCGGALLDDGGRVRSRRSERRHSIFCDVDVRGPISMTSSSASPARRRSSSH